MGHGASSPQGPTLRRERRA